MISADIFHLRSLPHQVSVISSFIPPPNYLYSERELNPHSHNGYRIFLLLQLSLPQLCLQSGLYLHHIFRLRCSVSSLYTFLISKAWLGIPRLKGSPNLRNSTLRVSSEALNFRHLLRVYLKVLRVYLFHHPSIAPYKSFPCTEQETGETLFLLFCSQDRIRTCIFCFGHASSSACLGFLSSRLQNLTTVASPD